MLLSSPFITVFAIFWSPIPGLDPWYPQAEEPVDVKNPLHEKLKGRPELRQKHETLANAPRYSQPDPSKRNVKSVITSASGYPRTIVEVHLRHWEEDRVKRIRYDKSKRIAPLGLRHRLYCAELPHGTWENTREKMKEIYPPDGRRSMWDWCFKYPLSWIAPRNFWNFITFQWTGWGKGDAAHARDQVVNEQVNVGLVSGLMLTVAASFASALLTPNVRSPPPDCESSADSLGTLYSGLGHSNKELSLGGPGKQLDHGQLFHRRNCRLYYGDPHKSRGDNGCR